MIDRFLNPKTIAVIGASNKKNSVGFALMNKLKSFNGNVFGINIKKEEIFGKQTYSNLDEIKEKIDLVIIAVPAKIVKDIILDCVKKEIKHVIIISAGFSEIGNYKLQQDIIRTARLNGIRVLGPNCFGIVNTSLNLDTTFSASTPQSGNIAFISQSGALWSGVSDWSLGENFGFSKFISLGNMGDLEFSELIDYLNTDPKTKVIVLYIEQLIEGKKFMSSVKKCKKPIIIIKAGTTKEGKQATLSHTGSLAGSYEIYKAAFEQSGAIIAKSLTNAFDIARFLCYYKKPKKAVIITNAGGLGVLATDSLIESNVQLIELPKKLIDEVKLSNSWSKKNPVDLVGDAKAEDYKEILSKLKKYCEYDLVLALFTPQTMSEPEETAKELINSKQNILACFIGGQAIKRSKLYLETKNILCFNEINRIKDILTQI